MIIEGRLPANRSDQLAGPTIALIVGGNGRLIGLPIQEFAAQPMNRLKLHSQQIETGSNVSPKQNSLTCNLPMIKSLVMKAVSECECGRVRSARKTKSLPCTQVLCQRLVGSLKEKDADRATQRTDEQCG